MTAGKLTLLYLAYKYVIQQLIKNSMTKIQNHVKCAQLIALDVL